MLKIPLFVSARSLVYEIAFDIAAELEIKKLDIYLKTMLNVHLSSLQKQRESSWIPRRTNPWHQSVIFSK